MSGLDTGLDTERIRAVLGTPGLEWLVERVRERVERGAPLRGAVILSHASPEQRAAVAYLLGRPIGGGGSLSVSLEQLDEELGSAGIAPDLRTAIEVLTGPLADLVDDQAGGREQREAMLAALRLGAQAGTGWYDDWIDSLVTDGTLKQLSRSGQHRVAGQAAAVLGRLPADDLPLTALAQSVTARATALTGTTLAGLVLRALAMREGVPPPGSAKQRRALWASVGVVADDLASQVLLLNVVGEEDHVVADWLRDAAGLGLPFRLTLQQVIENPVTPLGRDLYVCESPAVLRAAAAELAGRSAPLLCTEGQASEACEQLVLAAADAGARLHWRADFDWNGLRSVARAGTMFDAEPWRMTAADYAAAMAGADVERLRGASAASPWDDALARAMIASGRAAGEERLIPDLLADLELPPPS
jgi:uncharacterized protein (TIGR02679 family)